MKFESLAQWFEKRSQQHAATHQRSQRSRRVARRSRPAPIIVEILEDRTLLSVLPKPIVSPAVDVSFTQGQESSPTITVDPLNPHRAVAATPAHEKTATGEPIFVQGNYTIDGGTTWFPFYSPGAFPDPTNQKLPPFPEITNVTAAFDRNHKLYIVNSQHTADSK